MAKEMGHRVLQLLPYHYELNPVELVWAEVKNDISMSTATFKLPK
jgi:transposase